MTSTTLDQTPPDCCILGFCEEQNPELYMQDQETHCAAGKHCGSTTASCAAEVGADAGHPSVCCACKEKLS